MVPAMLDAARAEIAYPNQVTLDVRMGRRVREGINPPIERVAGSRIQQLDRTEGNRDQSRSLQKLEDRDHLD